MSEMKYAINVYFPSGMKDTSDLINTHNKTESEMMAWAVTVWREKCKQYPNFEVILVKKGEYACAQ